MPCVSLYYFTARQHSVGISNPLFDRQLRRWNIRWNLCESNPYPLAPSFAGDIYSLGRGAISMLNSIPVCLTVGCVLGFLAGLGVGGGSLLILWLSLVVGIDHSIARIINLMFFIPSAIIASLFRWHQGKLNIRAILPAIVAGCISAGCFSMLRKYIDIDFLRKLFGILLLLTGIRELLYKPTKKKKERH